MSAEIVRSDDVRKQNRHRIIEAVRSARILPRVDIAEKTALSPATVSTITTDLLSEGILVPAQGSRLATTGRGRPRIDLTLSGAAASVVIAVIQFNRISVSIVDYCGSILRQETRAIKTLALDRTQFIETIRENIADLLATQSTAPSQIVVGIQGVTDVGGTGLIWTPISRARDLPISTVLGDAFGVEVIVRNDCDMIALALSRADDNTLGENFATILLSQGVGMGLVMNGKPVNGTRSSATEFGHMVHIPEGARCRCGRNGCIEAYAGDYAIARRSSDISPDTPPEGLESEVDLEAIADRARNGDDSALAAFQAAGSALGYGIASLFALLDPLPVAIVGRGVVAFDIMQPKLVEAIAKSGVTEGEPLPEISVYPQALPLITRGCAIEALTAVDRDVAASTNAFQMAGE